MPKIRDLGINVIPETARPLEIGPGGGCGPTCGHCTHQTGYGGCGPSHCYHPTPVNCLDFSFQGSVGCCPTATVNCIPTYVAQAAMPCPGASQNCSEMAGQGGQGGGAAQVCLEPFFTLNRCPLASVLWPCQGMSQCRWSFTDCPLASVVRSDTCHPVGGGLSREAIAQLKEQLQKQIEQLDEIAKNIGPKTAEEIDAREQQLKAELEELARRRKDLQK